MVFSAHRVFFILFISISTLAGASKIYYLDIRLPGEALFGGKRTILLPMYATAPKKFTALTIVECKDSKSNKIEPLLAQEYYMFFIASGCILYIPKRDDVLVASLIRNEDGDVVMDLARELVMHQDDFPKQLKIIETMLDLHDEDTVEVWFHNPDDFCDRLKKTHPHEAHWPCCSAKDEALLSPLAPPEDVETSLGETSSGHIFQTMPLHVVDSLTTNRPDSCTF